MLINKLQVKLKVPHLASKEVTTVFFNPVIVLPFLHGDIELLDNEKYEEDGYIVLDFTQSYRIYLVDNRMIKKKQRLSHEEQIQYILTMLQKVYSKSRLCAVRKGNIYMGTRANTQGHYDIQDVLFRDNPKPYLLAANGFAWLTENYQGIFECGAKFHFFEPQEEDSLDGQIFLSPQFCKSMQEQHDINLFTHVAQVRLVYPDNDMLAIGKCTAAYEEGYHDADGTYHSFDWSQYDIAVDISTVVKNLSKERLHELVNQTIEYQKVYVGIREVAKLSTMRGSFAFWQYVPQSAIQPFIETHFRESLSRIGECGMISSTTKDITGAHILEDDSELETARYILAQDRLGSFLSHTLTEKPVRMAMRRQYLDTNFSLGYKFPFVIVRVDPSLKDHEFRFEYCHDGKPIIPDGEWVTFGRTPVVAEHSFLLGQNVWSDHPQIDRPILYVNANYWRIVGGDADGDKVFLLFFQNSSLTSMMNIILMRSMQRIVDLVKVKEHKEVNERNIAELDPSSKTHIEVTQFVINHLMQDTDMIQMREIYDLVKTGKMSIYDPRAVRVLDIIILSHRAQLTVDALKNSIPELCDYLDDRICVRITIGQKTIETDSLKRTVPIYSYKYIDRSECEFYEKDGKKRVKFPRSIFGHQNLLSTLYKVYDVRIFLSTSMLKDHKIDIDFERAILANPTFPFSYWIEHARYKQDPSIYYHSSYIQECCMDNEDPGMMGFAARLTSVYFEKHSQDLERQYVSVRRFKNIFGKEPKLGMYNQSRSWKDHLEMMIARFRKKTLHIGISEIMYHHRMTDMYKKVSTVSPSFKECLQLAKNDVEQPHWMRKAFSYYVQSFDTQDPECVGFIRKAINRLSYEFGYQEKILARYNLVLGELQIKYGKTPDKEMRAEARDDYLVSQYQSEWIEFVTNIVLQECNMVREHYLDDAYSNLSHYIDTLVTRIPEYEDDLYHLIWHILSDSASVDYSKIFHCHSGFREWFLHSFDQYNTSDVRSVRLIDVPTHITEGTYYIQVLRYGHNIAVYSNYTFLGNIHEEYMLPEGIYYAQIKKYSSGYGMSIIVPQGYQKSGMLIQYHEDPKYQHLHPELEERLLYIQRPQYISSFDVSQQEMIIRKTLVDKQINRLKKYCGKRRVAHRYFMYQPAHMTFTIHENAICRKVIDTLRSQIEDIQIIPEIHEFDVSIPIHVTVVSHKNCVYGTIQQGILLKTYMAQFDVGISRNRLNGLAIVDMLRKVFDCRHIILHTNLSKMYKGTFYYLNKEWLEQASKRGWKQKSVRGRQNTKKKLENVEILIRMHNFFQKYSGRIEVVYESLTPNTKTMDSVVHDSSSLLDENSFMIEIDS